MYFQHLKNVSDDKIITLDSDVCGKKEGNPKCIVDILALTKTIFLHHLRVVLFC